jgi:hypothetical protein
MTLALATIGAKGLYLLFIWLLSAAAGSWLSDRKGYGDRMGLAFGLLLTAVGFLIVLLLPARPGSKWKIDGPIPKRSRRGAARSGPQDASAAASAPSSSGHENS